MAIREVMAGAWDKLSWAFTGTGERVCKEVSNSMAMGKRFELLPAVIGASYQAAATALKLCTMLVFLLTPTA